MRGRVCVLAAVLVPALAFVCNQAHAPVVVSAFEEAVELEVVYSDGTSFSGVYPPGARIYAPSAGVLVQSVKVQTESGGDLHLNKEELAAMLDEVPEKGRVAWMIGLAGVRPVPLDQLDATTP